MTSSDTTVERLREAAAKIRKHAEAAHSEDWGNRAWHVEECDDKDMGSCACIVAQGEYRDFDQPQIPPVQYVADAELTVYADWIALMHPGVGEHLAQLLDERAWIAENDRGAFGTTTDAAALALADAILGPVAP